jgi:WD40 repeat protein
VLDGRYVLSGCAHTLGVDEQMLRLWDVNTGQQVREFKGHMDGAIPSVAFSRDGHRILSGSSDKTLRLWDVDTGQELHCFKKHLSTIWGVAFSPDGRYALSGSEDSTLRLWRLPDPPPPRK